MLRKTLLIDRYFFVHIIRLNANTQFAFVPRLALSKVVKS